MSSVSSLIPTVKKWESHLVEIMPESYLQLKKIEQGNPVVEIFDTRPRQSSPVGGIFDFTYSLAVPFRELEDIILKGATTLEKFRWSFMSRPPENQIVFMKLLALRVCLKLKNMKVFNVCGFLSFLSSPRS